MTTSTPTLLSWYGRPLLTRRNSLLLTYTVHNLVKFSGVADATTITSAEVLAFACLISGLTQIYPSFGRGFFYAQYFYIALNQPDLCHINPSGQNKSDIAKC